METTRGTRLGVALSTGGMLVLGACQGGSSPGTLIGTYAVRGVLVENTCGQTGLPTVNPLEFSLELREDQGVGYWIPTKNNRNSGIVNADGSFTFTTSQTQVLGQSSATQNLQPSDFAANSPDSNFDLRQTTCAVTVTERITGNLARWISLTGSTAAGGAGSAGVDMDLTGRDEIAVAPSAGSSCNAALTAFGGAYSALPCGASYVLRGTLDTSAQTAGSSPAAAPAVQPPATPGTAGLAGSDAAGAAGAIGSAPLHGTIAGSGGFAGSP